MKTLSARLGLVPLAILILLLSAIACTRQQGPSEEAAANAPAEAPKRPSAPETVRLTVPQGTEIDITISSGVSSATSQPGDTFTARTAEPVVVGNRVAIPADSTIYGQVAQVVPAKKGLKEKGGSITLSFDKVVTPAAYSAPMSAAVASVAPKSTGKTAGIIGGSAAGGAILGKVIGKDTKDAALGAIVGGAIGTGIAAGTKGKEVEIPAGSRLTITLDQPLTISARP